MTPENNKRIIVLDCEIKKMILGRNESYQDGLQYCSGWSDYAGMGISVVCVYDMTTKLMHTLTPEENEEHAAMLGNLISRADYIVGFNNNSFDNNLLAAAGFKIPAEKSYDIYAQVIDATGLSNAPFSARKGYKLDDIAQANQLKGKSGSGALAPVLYQNGQLDELYAYCEQDVHITVNVLHLILEGMLVCPRSGSTLQVITPHELLGSVQTGLF